MQKYWLLKDDLKDLFESFKMAVYEEQFSQGTVRIPPAELENLFNFLKNHKKFPMEMLTDLTTVDYLTSNYAEKPNLTGREEDLYSESRFDVVYHFYSMTTNKRIRIITSCGGEEPELLSCYKWWSAAHFLEREVFDMFGIKFNGHPDLRRVLLYEEFEGFPLRKDFPTMGEQPRITLRNPEQNNGTS